MNGGVRKRTSARVVWVIHVAGYRIRFKKPEGQLPGKISMSDV